MKNMFFIPFFVGFLLSTSHASSSVNDFCVADLDGLDSPSGFPCLEPNTLTADDFVFTFGAANTSNPNKAGLTTAFVNDFPALNGLDISAAHAVIDPKGFVPMHTHHATELIIAVQGEITAGFIASDKKVYVKTLKPGNIMVIPPTLLHFLVNSGNVKASGFAVFSSSNPGFHAFNDIFANNLASNILARTTFLDVAQVKKLKALFGGSG